MKTLSIIISCLLLALSVNLKAQQWEPMAEGMIPVDYKLWAISIVNENVVWATASYVFTSSNTGGLPLNHTIKVLRTLDGGETWECNEVFEAIGRVGYDLHAISADVAYLTSNELGNGSGRGLMRTTDGGETWEEVLLSSAGGVWVQVINEKDICVINRTGIALSSNGGETWEEIPEENLPEFASNEFTTIQSGVNSCTSVGDYIWFGTSQGRIYRSKDKGYSWEAFETPHFPGSRIMSVAFSDTLNGITEGINDFDNLNGASLMLRTRDGGETWEELPVYHLAFYEVSTFPNDQGIFYGSPSLITVIDSSTFGITYDYGDTWETYGLETPDTYSALQFHSEGVGWAGNSLITPYVNAPLFKWRPLTSSSQERYEEINTLSVYPNPVVDILTVDVGSKHSTPYQVYDMEGKLLDQGRFYQSKNTIDLSLFESGVYLLRIEVEGKVVIKRIVKM